MSDLYELPQGQIIGEYRLLRKLGGGGFGTVHLAEAIRERSQVALKILHMSLTESQDLRNFLNETRTMIRLHHPHIIPLLDVGLSSNNFPFFAMEYTPGGTLRDRHPKDSQVPLATIIEYIEQIASALQYAHDRHIIHRDVKPENMLLRADSTLLLSDFGIAKIMEQSALMSMQTQIGTPVYMAPEQYKGYPCFASDQYALAVAAYEWISGTPPFQGGTAFSLAVQHMTVPPPPLLNRLPALSPAIEQVILKALSKEPEQRFATVQAFATALCVAIQQAAASEVDTQKLTLDETPSKETLIHQSPTSQPIHAEPQIDTLSTPQMPLGNQLVEPEIAQTRPAFARMNKRLSPSRSLRRNLFVLGSGLLVGLLILALVINMANAKRETELDTSNVSHLAKKWNFQTGGIVYSSPEVIDNVVYIGSEDHNVYAIDALSGKQKWAFPTGNQVNSSPKVVNGVVYVGSGDKNVYAIDALSGKQKWAFPTGDAVVSSPKVTDGVVYVGSYDKNVYAIDALSGKQKWAFPTRDKVESSPAVVGGVAYVGSQDGNVYAINTLSGKQKWVFPTKYRVESPPTVVDGIVYVGSSDFYVYAIDAQSGQKKWDFYTGEWVTSSPAVVNGVVYVGSGDKKVYAIDTQSGLKKWAFPTGGTIVSSPAAVNGVVYVGSGDRNVYAIDAQSGQKKWAFQTEDMVYSSPAVVSNVVYVGSHDHNVYAFGLPTKTS